MGMSNKNFNSGLLGIVASRGDPISTPDPWTHETWLQEKQQHSLNTDLEHHSERHFPRY